MKELNNLATLQIEFQRLLDIPADSLVEADRLQMAELHCFKAIEELIELRKTFPSTLNKHEKNRPVIDRERIKEEFSDTLLYMINFANVWEFSLEEILDTALKVQLNNFIKVKTKMLNNLNSEILRVPGEVSGIGGGYLMPEYVFIGQNPAPGITPGYKFWSDPAHGSSAVLIPILERLGVYSKSYFTNVVKCVTPKNSKPTDTQTRFWMEFLKKELKIVSRGCPAHIVPMGKFAAKWLGKPGISHPASVQYGAITNDQFHLEVVNYLSDIKL